MSFATLRAGAITAAPSFTDLYQQYVERIYRYHLARTGAPQDAQDLTADTFHAALENFATYRPAHGSPAAWLMGIAHHKLVDYFRRRRLHLPLESAENHPTPRPSPEESVSRRAQMNQVATALRKLGPERAEALTLHFFGGLSLAETGQVMGKNEEAVKKLIHRGLADLRGQLTFEVNL